MISLRTDGACTPSGRYTGCGGWAYKIISDKVDFENSGGELNTTNNRMEIEGVIQGLNIIYEANHLFDNKVIKIFTDSQLIVKTIEGKYRIKKNRDKWKELFTSLEKLIKEGFEIEFEWEKGKSSPETKEIDKVAKKARDKMKEQVLENELEGAGVKVNLSTIKHNI